MSLINDQSAFISDVARLIIKAEELGIRLTGGELYRTQEQQNLHLKAGRTTLAHSLHQDRRAIDFNFFVEINGSWSLSYDKTRIQPLGDYWESLNPKNSWGGNWKTFIDVPHFERKP